MIVTSSRVVAYNQLHIHNLVYTYMQCVYIQDCVYPLHQTHIDHYQSHNLIGYSL